MHRPRLITPRSLAIAFLACVLLAPGCAYAHHVGKDFGESFHLGLGVSSSPGIKVSARASLFTIIGAWMPDSYYIGTDHGVAGLWRERSYAIPLYHGITDRWYDEEPTPDADQVVPAYLAEDVYFILNVPIEDVRLDDLSPPLQMLVRGSQVEVGVHLAYIGASLGVNVAQLCDWVAALVGFDPLGDRPNPYEEAD